MKVWVNYFATMGGIIRYKYANEKALTDAIIGECGSLTDAIIGECGSVMPTC